MSLPLLLLTFVCVLFSCIITEYVICRHCGSDITLSNFFINKLSPYALTSTNQTFYQNKRILLQNLENPFGLEFQVAIVHRAHCAIINAPVS